MFETRKFLNRVDHGRVVEAIREAELKTSGEIQVYVSRRKQIDAMDAAQKKFSELKLTRTKERNAVLIYIVPLSRILAVLGDEGIHQKCGQEFWKEVVDSMIALFHKEQFTDGIVKAIEILGQALQKHFPRCGDDRNELPDRVIES
jgi:uncharacterized membrane protein